MRAVLGLLLIPFIYIVARRFIIKREDSLIKTIALYVLSVAGINGAILILLFILGKERNIVYKMNGSVVYFAKYMALSACIGMGCVLAEAKPGRIQVIVNKILEKAVHLEKYFLKWIKEHIKFILLNTVFGIFAYFMMIAGNLVNNYDGIWNTSYKVAGAMETASGRGILHYIDELRSGVVSMPLNSILTLVIISVAAVVVLDLFSVQHKSAGGILASAILIVNPITCVTLSYCYTSVGYGVAFLLSVIAVCCICCKNRIGGVCGGGICIALSLGCYQAYFGVTCLLLLLLLMKKFLQNVDIKEVAEFVIKCILSIVVGGILYVVITNILLNKYGVAITSYKGASEISLVRIIMSLPKTVVRCYREFFKFFFTRKMYLSALYKSSVLIKVVGLFFVFCLIKYFGVIWRKNRWFALCFLACVCLIPVACNVIILIAVGDREGMNIHMSMSLAISPAIGIMLVTGTTHKRKRIDYLVKRIGYLLVAVLLWANILAVTNDQLALKEGKTAATEPAEVIVHELTAEGYLGDDSSVALVGKPSESSLFAKRTSWSRANDYAKFGDWWADAGNNRRSWQGVLDECCGIQLNLCSAEEYEKIIEREEVLAMPQFPAKGSVKEIEGIVVVKVSGKD